MPPFLLHHHLLLLLLVDLQIMLLVVLRVLHPPTPGIGGPPPPQPPPPASPRLPPHMGGRAPSQASTPLGPEVAQPLARVPKVEEDVEAGSEGAADASKAKLKPFSWDKVQANSVRSMVWNQIKGGSSEFNKEMIETLFGYWAMDKNKGLEKKKDSSSPWPSPQYIQIIESKKSRNLSILLCALNVTLE